MSDLFDDSALDLETPQDVIIDPEDIPFVKVPKPFIEQYGKELGPLGIATYVGLRFFANRKRGMSAFPAIKSIAELTGMGESTVRRELGRLESMGFITKEQRIGRSTIYVITPPRYNIAEGSLQCSGESATIERRNKKNLTRSKEQLSLSPQEEAKPSLHKQVQTYIQTVYQQRFNTPASWDGSEAKQLKSAIDANPTWTFPLFKKLIDNRYASEGVNGERPRIWLGDLGKYAMGPLDKFGKPLGKSPVVEQRVLSVSEKLRARAAGVTQ